MIKNILIVLVFPLLLLSSEQIILIVSDDMDSFHAKMECFEDGEKLFETIDVNLGANGLGWGLGIQKLSQKKGEPLKYEGDKKAPAGVFKLTAIFGYEKEPNYKLPYLYATTDLLCVDDSNSKHYNTILHKPSDHPKSYEVMRREDAQYELGVVVAHNSEAKMYRGSCIFMHVYKSKDAPTAGCSAMHLEDIKKVASWLDAKKKPLLIQIPKSSAKEILELYPQLKGSRLLQR
jgi:hypothetical protein